MKQKMEIYDATLREGTQARDVNLTVHDKLEIVKALDAFGVDYIELGWPGSNPKDMESFLQASKIKLKNAKIAAFGSTKRVDTQAKDDHNLNAIIKSKASVATLFGKTWKLHIEKQLRTTPQKYLDVIYESVAYLKKKKLKVFYDAEHFFDGYEDDKDYAIKCLEFAAKANADCLVLCDTNGGKLPFRVSEIVKEVKEHLEKKNIKTPLGVHFHNDSGCAVANSLIVSELIEQVQVTVNGLGERTGNADLCQVVPNLVLKKNIKLPKIKLKEIRKLSDIVYILANIKPDIHQPYVGASAFAHKAGIHVDAVMKGVSYEHIKPELVGSNREIILSDLSGKANIVEVAKKFGVKTDKNDPRVKHMLKEVEVMEMRGYGIGDLPAEKALLVNRHFSKKKEFFTIKTWKVMAEHRDGEYSECVLTGTVDGKPREVVAPLEGGGPVGAAYQALQKLIATGYKQIRDVSLINYKVMIAEDKGPESSVRVYIEFQNHKETWGTVGVSTNILEASIEAIEKGFRYYLQK